MTTVHELTLDIGSMPILVRTESAEFAQMLADRYGEFVAKEAPVAMVDLDIRLEQPGDGTRGTGHGKDEKTGYGTRDTGREDRDSGFGIRGSGIGLQTPDFGLRTPNPETLTPNPESRIPDPDADLSVRRESGRWVMERGDFRAEWDPECRRGWVRQTANPYSIDGVLRVLHSLILAREGGFLVHAASAVRSGRAFVFAGVSGTGKTTISRLAPADVTLLTDEISYIRHSRDTGFGTRDTGVRSPESGVRSRKPEVRSEESGAKAESQISNLRSQIAHPQSPITNCEFRTPNSESRIPNPELRIPNPESLTRNSESRIPNGDSRVPHPVSLAPCAEHLIPGTRHLAPAFSAFGTPFAGELARIGQKVQAPLATLFLLQQGPENRIEPVSDGQAVRELMRHVLFFAHDQELVGMIFQTVCDFVRRVPVRRLVFTKDASVWELIG
ncbi:MAG: hypothetical protein ACLQVL_33785 [Terriglobia bacterium]